MKTKPQRPLAVILSCEHGGNKIPPLLKNKLKISNYYLNSHRGFDRGAAGIAKFLKKELNVPLVIHDETRLLIDYNRSPKHQDLWSVFSNDLNAQDKNFLLNRYQNYRAGS